MEFQLKLSGERREPWTGTGTWTCLFREASGVSQRVASQLRTGRALSKSTVPVSVPTVGMQMCMCTVGGLEGIGAFALLSETHRPLMAGKQPNRDGRIPVL